jgi:hypothetical protein
MTEYAQDLVYLGISLFLGGTIAYTLIQLVNWKQWDTKIKKSHKK